jgi:hypothetical protein
VKALPALTLRNQVDLTRLGGIWLNESIDFSTDPVMFNPKQLYVHDQQTAVLFFRLCDAPHYRFILFEVTIDCVVTL